MLISLVKSYVGEEQEQFSGRKKNGETIPETMKYQYNGQLLLVTSKKTTKCITSQKKLCKKL